jgi:hypothetical protein
LRFSSTFGGSEAEPRGRLAVLAALVDFLGTVMVLLTVFVAVLGILGRDWPHWEFGHPLYDNLASTS